MQLEFTEDQEELRDSVQSVLARESTPAYVRSVIDGGASGAALYATMVELGWPALTIAEDLGGLGMTFVEVAIVLEQLGRVAAPGPYLSTVTQFVPAVQRTGTQEQAGAWLTGVLSGEVTGALVRGDIAVRSDNGAYVLDGIAEKVLCAPDVSHFVVAAGDGLFVIPAARATLDVVNALDPTRGLADVGLDGVRAEQDAVLAKPGEGTESLARIVQETTCGIAIETLGACSTVFDMTLAYSKEREQFGRPIGSFQAIKHKLADMFVARERAHALCYFAALTIAEEDERAPLAVSMAKSAVGDAQRLIVADGLQVHGGVGYTWEHDLHLFLRRAKTGDALFGTGLSHRSDVADLLAL